MQAQHRGSSPPTQLSIGCLRRYEAERLSDGRRYALKVTELQALGDADRSAVVEEVRLLVRRQAGCMACVRLQHGFTQR